VNPPLGETPVGAKEGGTGFTVAQTGRLLGCSEGTVRNNFGTSSLRDNRNRLLCPADEVLKQRSLLLQQLGAVEGGIDADEDLEKVVRERDDLRARLATAEEKIRLIVAARSAAREKEIHSLAEEKAYLEMALLDLDPLRQTTQD
jgi:hypothetical protein